MTFVAGTVLAASDLNTHLRDQLNVLRGGGIAISGQTAQDVIIASSSTQLGRLPLGTSNQVVKVNDAGTALEFGQGYLLPLNDPALVGQTMFGRMT